MLGCNKAAKRGGKTDVRAKFTHPTAASRSSLGLGLGPALTTHRLAELTGQPQLQTMTLTSNKKAADMEGDRRRPHALHPLHGV